MIPPKSISIDFDGTIAYHHYPMLGQPVDGAHRVVAKLKDAGHILILETMRHGDLLEDAKAWCEKHGFHFDYINMNPTYETGSRKIYSHLKIDDHNLGIPLKQDPWEQRKPFVDWDAVEKILVEKGYL